MALANLCLCLLAGLQLAAAAGVLHLDASSFHKTIDTKEATLVMFYAPWCPHCKEAEPKFMSAAKEVAKEEGKALGMVNCDEKSNQDLCSKQNIEGYPTFKFFSKGKLIQDYEDEPSEKSFIEFMKNPPKEGEKRPAAAAAGGDDGQRGEDSEPDTMMQSVTYLGANNYTDVLNKNNFVLVFFYAPWCPHCKDSKPKFEKAAQALEADPISGSIMAAMNCDAKENQKLCEDEKVEGYPTVRLMKKTETWAEFEEEVETKPLLDLIRKPPAEKVLPTPMEDDDKKDGGEQEQAAEKPEDKMKNVRYLEGNEQMAELKKTPLALVMFYAPWCGHCQEAKPSYDKAAGRLASDGDRILAAVNCDVKANEKVCEDYKIEGFPTFMLFANGAKKEDYTESPITEEGILKFMQSQKTGGKDEL